MKLESAFGQCVGPAAKRYLECCFIMNNTNMFLNIAY